RRRGHGRRAAGLPGHRGRTRRCSRRRGTIRFWRPQLTGAPPLLSFIVRRRWGHMTDALAKSDTESLLRGLREYAPDAELRFESLAVVFARELPWYARLWCVVLLGRTAADPARAVEVLGRGLLDAEFRVRAAVLGALA